MKLEMRGKGIELTDELKAHIERRFRFALTRFGSALRRVRVHLTDINGPKGGLDVRCRVRVDHRGVGQLVIQETNEDPFAAVVRATERAAHSLTRRLGRLHARRRGRLPRLRTRMASA